MEPIPKHEKKGLLATDLYQSIIAHPEQINKLCEAISDFDYDMLYDRYLSESGDAQHGSNISSSAMADIYSKTTDLELKLRLLNRHIEGNTSVFKFASFGFSRDPSMSHGITKLE